MAVSKQSGLQHPGSGRKCRGPDAPTRGDEAPDRAGCQAKEKDRSQTGAWQILPRRNQNVSGQTEQRIKRGMAVRLFPRERPKPLQDLAFEEQFPPRIKLAARRGRRFLRFLDHLKVGGQRTPLGGEPNGIAQPPKPISQPRLAAKGVTFVPDDGHLRKSRQHQDKSGETDAQTNQETFDLRSWHVRNASLCLDDGFVVRPGTALERSSPFQSWTAARFGTSAGAKISGSVERISATSGQLGNDGQRTHSFQIR